MVSKFRKLPVAFQRWRFALEARPARKDPKGWRERHPLLPLSANPVVTFATPIFERQRAPDWDAVVHNLRATIAAVRRQTNPNWRMIVCSQDKPEGIDFDDQVMFLRYGVSHYGEADKHPKLMRIARHVAQRFRDDGYYVFLDGDDLPHPDLVEFFLRDRNDHGYTFEKGYVADVASGVLLEPVLSEGIIRPFHWYCGSSTAVRFDARRDNAHILHVGLRGDHMRSVQHLHDRVGLQVGSVPFPAMLYVVQHGSSDQDLLKAQKGVKRRVAGVAPVAADRVTGILQDFGVPDLFVTGDGQAARGTAA